ncbi:MAG: hypothetical protein WCF65_06780 [Parachlamydiaceae bacterium]
MQSKSISLLLFGFLICLFWNHPIAADYVRPPYVSEDVWNKLSPYFLPENFPEKAILDKAFSRRQVLKSIKSMIKSGFFIITNPKNKIIVAKHIRMQNYLIKVYLDGSPGPVWDCWLRRVQGAQMIQKGINLHGYQSIMKVPRKWIYPLPYSATANAESKHFILVVDKINILNDKKNRGAYKRKMTPELLDALYSMLTEYKLIDSVYPDNVPFCRDGKLAFVDTEYAGGTAQPVPLGAVKRYLSKSMSAYWEQLISQQ